MSPPTRAATASAQPLRVSPAGGSADRVRVNSQTRHESVSALSAASWTVQPCAARLSDQLWRPSPAGRQSLSLGRRLSASVIGPPDYLLGVVGPVEAQHRGLAVELGFQVDGPSPDVLYVGQSVLGLVQLQIYPIVVVPQLQFTAVAVVPVDDVDPRLAEVGQAEEQSLLDILELPALDDVVLALLVVVEREELVLPAELRSQEGVDEGVVVVDLVEIGDVLSSHAE